MKLSYNNSEGRTVNLWIGFLYIILYFYFNCNIIIIINVFFNNKRVKRISVIRLQLVFIEKITNNHWNTFLGKPEFLKITFYDSILESMKLSTGSSLEFNICHSLEVSDPSLAIKVKSEE